MEGLGEWVGTKNCVLGRGGQVGVVGVPSGVHLNELLELGSLEEGYSIRSNTVCGCMEDGRCMPSFPVRRRGISLGRPGTAWHSGSLERRWACRWAGLCLLHIGHLSLLLLLLLNIPFAAPLRIAALHRQLRQDFHRRACVCQQLPSCFPPAIFTCTSMRYPTPAAHRSTRAPPRTGAPVHSSCTASGRAAAGCGSGTLTSHPSCSAPAWSRGCGGPATQDCSAWRSTRSSEAARQGEGAGSARGRMGRATCVGRLAAKWGARDEVVNHGAPVYQQLPMYPANLPV